MAGQANQVSSQSGITRKIFEAALDGGRLETRMPEFVLNDPDIKWHKCRRNGQTRGFGHGRFVIPIAFGRNSHAQVTEAEFVNGHIAMWFRINRGAR
jgi:hypothetical protein